MSLGKGKTVEVDIESLAFGGRGIAKVDGFVIFVEGVIPGDRAAAKIYRKKRQFAEARAIEIISPSEKRIDPKCEYFGTCGGCKWQFLSYEDQLFYKKEHVRESFEHIGLVEGLNILDALGSPEYFHHRNKMEFTFTERRWLTPSDLEQKDLIKGKGVGLHVPGVFNKIVDIKNCMIQPEKADEILECARELMMESDHEVYDQKNHEGYFRFLMIRHSLAFDEYMVNIVTAYEDKDEMARFAERISSKFPEVTSIVNNITSKKANICVGDYEIPVYGRDHLVEKLGKYEFEISANSFFQTNTKGAVQLYDVVKDFADLKGDEFVIDLYTGTGSIAIYLSDNAGRILGVELVESAILDARKNCLRNGIENCEFKVGDLKDVAAELKETPDLLICDPPRAGMHKNVVSKIMELAPKKVIYVSCNPSTMARDIGILKEKYDIRRVQPVDMFPHTYHIEAVAELVLR